MKIKTPYYLIDEKKLLKNLQRIKLIREASTAKVLLATKCFCCPSVFNLMKQYLDGTVSSSVYETKLGSEEFGKETVAYCVGYSKEDIDEIKMYADKIIFNSISQLKMFGVYSKDMESVGLRINPNISYSHFDLANPSRKNSRLGVGNVDDIIDVLHMLDGVMFHFNCENDDFNAFSVMIDYISTNFSEILKDLEWVSLGGGIYFSKENYPVQKFCEKIKSFSKRFNVQVYLEPGESIIDRAGELVTTVVDITNNDCDLAIVDASIEAHMLDLLTYRQSAILSTNGKYKYTVCGRSCLAGDIFGTYKFKDKLNIGDEIRFENALGYSIVKKNWFNGLQMPSIVVKRLDDSLEIIRTFTYNDFRNSI